MQKKFAKRLLALMLASFATFSSVNSTSFAAGYDDDESVVVNVSSAPYMDIVLTQTDMGVNVSNFEKDLKAQLKAQGLDTTNAELIHVTAVETSKADLQNSFSWKQDLNTSIGQISTTSNGVTMKGNRTTPGKNAVYCMPTQNGNIYDFSYNYNIAFGDSFSAAGMLLNIKENGNYLEGYMISFNKSGYPYYSTSGANAALWKVRWQKGTNTSLMSLYSGQALTATPGANQAYLVRSLGISTSGTLNVRCEDDRITISGGGLSKTEIPIDKNWGDNGFGFFSQHYSHNCNQIGQFQLNGISMNITTIKEYTDILSQPSWREDAYHFIVNVDNTTAIYDNKDTRANTLSRTMNDDIRFVDWGTTATQSKVEQFIRDNDGKGFFVLSSNYSDAIAKTANYIVKETTKEFSSSQEADYVIVGENINMLVNPEDLKTNTANENWPNGKWYITHDYKYFDNNTGLSSQTQSYSPDLLCSFDKPGKYDIYFCDNLVKTVYAHRKPVADFSVAFDGANVNLTSQSYDLDSNENNGLGKGIKKETWSYMKNGDSSWTEGKLTKADSGVTYIIKLEVEDMQGATNYTTKYIGLGNPVASFIADTTTFSKYHDLVLTDTSYDPARYGINGWQWSLKKARTEVATYTTQSPKIDFTKSRLGAGEYTLSLKVKNTQGTWSETYSRGLTVLEDTVKPSVTIDPSSCDWTDKIDIHIQIEDADSGLDKWRYCYTQSQDAPTSSQWGAWQTKSNETLTFDTDGEYYLHFEAYDKAGNKLERTIGTYKITHPYTNKVTHHVDGFTKSEFVTYDWGKLYAPTKEFKLALNGYKVKENNLCNYPVAGTTLKAGERMKQPAAQVDFDLYYEPETYTVTYDFGIEGVEVEGLATTYTVLDGFELPTLSKEGYTFGGWYANGKRVYGGGINLDVDNDFESIEDMISSLKTRTSGDLVIKANWQQMEFTEGTNVYAELASNFEVTIPKVIVLAGNQNGASTASYFVKATGDIAGEESVKIQPDEYVTLSTKNKESVNGTISQEKTVWTVDELEDVQYTGSISADLTAGRWAGTFNFNIELVDAQGNVNSEESVTYKTLHFPSGEVTDYVETTNE